MNHPTSEKVTPTPDEHSEGLLPAFSAKQYSHLPTPQSPNSVGRYAYDRQHSPDSPIPNGTSSVASSNPQNKRTGSKLLTVEEGSARTQSNSRQCITPESSPHFSHNSAINHNNPATPRYFPPPSSNDFTTPKQNSVKQGFPVTNSSNTFPRISTPSAPRVERVSSTATLSSPFMAKLSIGERATDRSVHANNMLPSHVDDVFSSSQISGQPVPPSSFSTPPVSPFQQMESTQAVPAGGEMERIRQSMMADRLAHIQEAEKHRPDYLKRSKRTLSEADPLYAYEDDSTNDRVLPVGIMESPHKGRRLKLFQETSEESFEESLMAGGYGRYRTADWVRQPQPISLPSTAVAGSSTIASLLEEAEEAPPSEKELKKRKRLAAFRSEPSHSKLSAVEFIGKGRLLIDTTADDPIPPASPEPPASKKKSTGRRKKRTNDVVANRKQPDISEQQLEKPNWPDSEFPWRLRTEERLELAKAEEEERLHWIERFLDRDSDDEDDAEPAGQALHDLNSLYDYPSSEVPRPGRGKMVPLTPYAEPGWNDGPLRRSTFPTDPADARAALLSKRSVRALSYRQQRRQRELDDDDDDEIVCICNGRDDGRELVQCDACQTWYHLECIGIKNIAELGREEDPWFCRRCVARSRSPSMEPEVSTREPTFVPTDEEHSFHRSSDTPFFQPGPHDSPHWSAMRVPRTPPREYPTQSDSHSSWVESSRPGPSTPQHSSARIYSSPFGTFPITDDSPFDPTSTPSRGIKFNAPFVTPKSNGWSSRTMFQSPTRPTASRGKFVNLDLHNSSREDHGGTNYPPNHEIYGRPNPFDESPIRRADVNPPSHRIISSPSSRQRQAGANPPYLEESPVMRSLGSRSQKDSVSRRAPHDQGMFHSSSSNPLNHL